MARLSKAWSGMAVVARRGLVWLVGAWRGLVWLVVAVKVGLGLAW